MRWRRASAILSLVRWQNGVLAAVGVLVGAWWARGPRAIDADVWLVAVGAWCLAAFANAVNDIADIEIDRVAHPHRPLPSGALSVGAARRVAGLAAVLGLVLSALARPVLGAVSLGVLIVMEVYSTRLKPLGLLGNMTVAVLASLPFLYGAWSVGRPGASLPLLALAVPLHLAREIAKDLDDAAADAATRRTVPVRWGVRGARLVLGAALLAFVAVLASFAVGKPRFALLVLPALALCLAAGARSFAGRRGGPALLKTAMLLAMAALVIGAR